jgi:hypothetical protein
MLLVVGHQHKQVRQRHCGDGDITVRKRVTLLAPLTEQIAGELGNLPGYRVEFEAAEKLLRSWLARPGACPCKSQ